MKYILMVILYMIALAVGMAETLSLTQVSLWYIVPFLGGCIGTWYSAIIILFILNNAKQLKKMSHIILNASYVLQKKVNAGDSRVQEFIQALSMDHEVFKKRFFKEE